MRAEDDAPLADESGAFPNDMPLEPGAGDEDAAERPERTDEQTSEPRPDRD
jgi:hypothetical protein